MAKPETEIVEEITNKNEPASDPKQTKGRAKAASNNGDMKLMSLGIFAANTPREDITVVLQAGFRVWMKTAKHQPLRSRTAAEWDKLFNEYLKS